MAKRVTLEDWRHVVRLKDDCPWPGPRPLTADDPKTLLCGRDDDQLTFRQRVDKSKLVFLGGRTGVGKSSLLLRGLIPQLRRDGYTVAVCRSWSGAADHSNAAAFLAERIRPSLQESGLDVGSLPEGAALFARLSREYGSRAVLVLDQFEELIRDAPAFTSELFAAVAFLNQRTEMKVVISLRSEYEHELKPLENSLKPLSFFYFRLEDIDDKYAADVIAAPNTDDREVIDRSFAAELAELWRAARAEPGSPVGLLHLQGLLFVLDSLSDDDRVTPELLEEFRARSADGDGPDGQSGLFELALQDAVDTKMDRCRDAAREVGLDPYLVEGTALVAARMVRHLSSAGYKLVREAFDLAEMSIGDDLAILSRGFAAARQDDRTPADGPLATSQKPALLAALIGTLGSRDGGETAPAVDLFADRATLAGLADALDPSAAPGRDPVVPWTERLHPGADPSDADPRGVTSGPMMGLAPAAALIEELRRFTFALEWLSETQLVRRTSPRSGVEMIALIHDGFGEALARWAGSDVVSRCGGVYGLTAPAAAEFMWKEEGSIPDELDGETSARGVRVLANLRWRGAWVKADFRRLVFANCDFRGSQFQECTFEGVSFINCLLDGVMLSDCTVIGRPLAEDEDEWVGQADEFELDGVDDVVRTLGRYRGTPMDSGVLLCGLPQRPALPAAPDADRRRLPIHHSGLAIYGGRTSSLLVRGLAFTDAGCLSLRETAGSGVDIVEHRTTGSYEILSSSLRHVTFTSSPMSDGGGEPITVVAKKSLLFQLWLGNDLSGSFTADDSVLLQCWNGSPDMKAALVVGEAGETCRYHDLVGFEVGDEHAPIGPDPVRWAVDELDPDESVRNDAVNMDYRRDALAPLLAERSGA